MAIRCVLFDADGVVITSELFSVQYQKQFNVSNNEMLPFFQLDFQKCLVGKADLKESIKPWLNKWNWNGTVNEFMQFWFKSEDLVDDLIIKTINQLKKQKILCCLATNQEKYRTQYLKEELGFNEIFDYIFSSSEIGYKKPDTEFFQYILSFLKSKYNLSQEEILFIDDGLENIRQAEKLGIKSHHYNTFPEFEIEIKEINFS